MGVRPPSRGPDNDTQGNKARRSPGYESNSSTSRHPWGRSPECWGIHDMLGHVWEWVQASTDYDTVPRVRRAPPRAPSTCCREALQAHSKNVRVSVHPATGSVISTGLRVLMEAR